MSTIEVIFAGGKKVDVAIKGFTVKTDQDIHAGGEGTAPDPFTLFLSSLAACAGVYAKTFCDQREIQTEDIHIQMDTKYDPEIKLITHIQINIKVPGDFPEKYENALIQAVGLCAVKRHLSEKIKTDVFLVR